MNTWMNPIKQDPLKRRLAANIFLCHLKSYSKPPGKPEYPENSLLIT